MQPNTVAQFATELKLAPQVLLEQLRAAGVEKRAETDSLSEDDKARLLEALRKAHGGLEIEKRKITLTRRQTSAIKQADSTGKARTIQVEVRKKRVFVKRDVESEVEAVPAAPVIDSEELARREQEERHQAELVARQVSEARERAERAQRELEEAERRRREASEKSRTDEEVARADQQRVQTEQDSTRRTAEAAAAQQQLASQAHERARKVVEDEVAAIKSMMATPTKKVLKAPAPEGTLHRPAIKPEAKPVEEKKDDKKAGAKEVKSVKLASSWSEDAAKRRTIKTRGDAGAGTAAWRGPKGHRRTDEREKSAMAAPAESVVREVSVPETITVADLAHKMSVKASEVIKVLMKLGQMVTINQVLDQETAIIVAEEMGHKAFAAKLDDPEAFLLEPSLAITSNGEPTARPPVVTVMGHVDHGKTSLLDVIRETEVAAGEAGGITQHIGASVVHIDGRKIVFVDTPGHEAFTRMRARGAKVTDIVVLVVAADDGVMPQTQEAIDHARAAGVPIIVAINKIDKPEAQVERVKRQLSDRGLMPEEWGGDTVMVEVSAKQKTNLNKLLEMILLVADLRELKSNPKAPAAGTVLESRVDKGRGAVATIMVQTGTLHTGDVFICGAVYGKVRAMFDDHGRPVRSAGPSTPVEVLGLQGAPEAGDQFQVADEARARHIVEFRQGKLREATLAKSAGARITLDQLHEQLKAGDVKELPLVIKADVQGSVEVLSEMLPKLSDDRVKLKIIHASIGAVTENDVLLASASGAIIVAFNVRPDRKASDLAQREGVEVRPHTIIYEVSDEIKKAMTGLLDPVFKETHLGRAEVRDTFRVKGVGMIAGCYVLDGVLKRDAEVRVLREGVVIYTGRISSLRRFKDDASEVRSGFECGASVSNFNDIKVGDVLECFHMQRLVLAEASA